MNSLYLKYRPKDFNGVIGQESIIKILKQQLDTDNIFNCMIFSGVSGTGKTTVARIFADEVNKHCGYPIEIDAASNNGVDNVKQIVSSAAERSINSEYKVYIIDEAHMLSTQAWNAFLKTIEEPPKYTIFIFCTTDPHKIPETIQNRCMRFNFTRVVPSLIEQKLDFICRSENNIINWKDSINYISRVCDGEVRKAISMLETCIRYDYNMSIDKTLSALGNISYDRYFDLINYVVDGNLKEVQSIIEYLYSSGNDLKKFIDLFIDFCLDILKYILTQDIQTTKFPVDLEERLKFTVGFKDPNMYYLYILDKLLELKNMIKNDENSKNTIQIVFSQMCRLV